MKKIFSCIIAAVMLVLGAAVAAGCGSAKSGGISVKNIEVLGSGGYGAVFNAQIDPFNASCFGATCDMSSVYFSFDTGNSWMRHDLQGTVYCLKYDPSAEGVVWAAGSGVYKSVDHGRTMKLVFPREDEVTAAGHNYENANYWIYTDGASDYAPQYQIWSIAIDRSSNGKCVFVGQRMPSAGMGTNKCVRIYRTTDGEHFSLFKELDYEYNYKLDYDEVNDCLVFVTKNKIFEIDMDGNIAAEIDQPVYVQHESGNTVSFDSYYDRNNNKNTFVFSAPSAAEHIACACYKTNDLRDKSSYIDITAALPGLTVDELGVSDIHDYDRGRPSYEYCEWIDGKTVPQTFAWTIGNVHAQSDDVVYMFHEANTDVFDENGAKRLTRRTIIYLKYDGRAQSKYRWVFGFPFKPYNTHIQNTAWPDADSDFCFGLSSSPQNENALLYCSNVGLYYTADCGENITQLNSRVLSRDELEFSDGEHTAVKSLQRSVTTGVDVICTHSLVTDPFDSDHLIMCCTDIGILQSYDNGKSWYHSLNEWQNGSLVSIAYARYTNACFDVHFDKQRKNVVYGLWSLAKSAPYAPSVSYLTGPARFGISYDGGLSWVMKSITHDGNCQPYRLQVTYSGNERRVYIATMSHGIFYSDDLGDTFTDMNAGLLPSAVGDRTAIWVNDLVVCDAGIFAATGGASSDSSENAAHMFYKWNERSAAFEQIGLPSAVCAADGKSYAPAAIRDIEYDDANDCLYLACIARSVKNGSTMVKAGGGIWKYKNGEFTQVYNDAISVFSVNLDGTGRLYAAELSGRVVRFDGALKPELVIDGLFHMLKRVCFGAGLNILYVPTWGGGTIKITLSA